MQAGIVLFTFQPIYLVQRLSVMPHTIQMAPVWLDDQVAFLYCTTDASALPSFAPRTGNGVLRMGWNGLSTCAFVSSEGKAKTFNKTFTTAQMSVSLHPRFPPSVKLYRDALHFPLRFYFFPPYTPYSHADNKGWSFRCPVEWGLFSVFWCLLVKKHFRLRWTNWYSLG